MEAPKLRPTAEDRVRAALWFAERGFGVFPCWSTTTTGRCRCPRGGNCTSPGKHPITPDGFQNATTNPERIKTFLSHGSDPNYGLLPPDGVFVWDVDTDQERAALARQAEANGPLPQTLRDTTANGEHVFWRWPEGYPRPLHKMFGLVTRWGSGAGAGYVIGPRSVHASGAEYRSAPDSAGEIATLPDTWAKAAVAGESDTVRIGGPVDPASVAVGGRHDFLRNRARLYAGTVRNPEALFAAVMADNQQLPEPKSVDEVKRAIGDALAKFPPDQVEEDPETGETRRVFDDSLPLLRRPETGDFPTGPAPAAFGGLLGECADAIAIGTDASRVGLLGSLIAFSGALVPGMAYFHRLQTSSPYIALVGESSIGRKGTAMNRAKDALVGTFGQVDVSRVELEGLASGEGLISTLNWKQTQFTREPTVGLVFEEEYASLIAARGREGSTLDPKMRAAFDGGPLSNRKANDTTTVVPPYWLPALIAITPDELRERLEPGALRSGSANRWLYLPVVKRDVGAANTPPMLTDEQQTDLSDARRLALERRDPLTVAPDVTQRLSDYADFLGGVSSGTSADLVRRLPVIAFRVGLIHALCDRSSAVRSEHLERALALTEYARSGLSWVFGGTTSNPDADLLLRHLQEAGRLRQHAITRHLIRDPLRRQKAIDEIERLGYGKVELSVTGNSRAVTELVLTPTGSRFVQFVPHPSKRDNANSEIPGRTGQTPSKGLDEPWTNPGQTVDEPGRTESAKTAWTNPGQTVDEPSGWAIACRNYRDHQASHRQTPKGWVCDACAKEEEA